jgi:hypothetical protein
LGSACWCGTGCVRVCRGGAVVQKIGSQVEFEFVDGDVRVVR